MTQAQGPMGPFCQSCGMPMSKPEDFGTMEGGWRQNDYCHYCYEDGKFLQPDSTLEEMIEQVIGPTAQATGMSEAEARALAERQLPHLKRWQ